MKLIYITLFSFVLINTSCGSKSTDKKSDKVTDKTYTVDSVELAVERTGIPIFDLTKSYPKKDFVLQDVADVTYIPLETSKQVLLDSNVPVFYFSKDKLITVSWTTDDVFVFDGNGKIQNTFNRKGKGGEEYQSIRTLVYDEINDEIIVLDYLLLHRCKVYSCSGQYKRTLNLPAGFFIGKLYNFDSETLLAFHYTIVRYKIPYF